MRRDIVGTILAKERKRRNLTQQDIADQMELGKTTISHIERGLPTIGEERYMDYAQYLGIAEELFGIEGKMKKRERQIMKELIHIEDIVIGNPKEAQRLINSLMDEALLFPSTKSFFAYIGGRSGFETGIYGEAQMIFQEALKSLDECPDLEKSNIRSMCLNDLGRIAFRRGDFQTALDYTEEAIRHFHEDGERIQYKPNFYLNKVIYLEELGRDEEACRELEFLYEHIEKFKENIAPVIQIHEQYATLLLKSGLPIKALEYAQKGLQVAHKNNQFRRLFSIWSLMGNIHVALGNTEEAETRFRKALVFSKYVADSPDRIGRTHLNYGKLLITKGDVQQAEEQLSHAIKFLERTESKEPHLIDALVTLANLKQEEEWIKKVDKTLSFKNSIRNVPVDIFLKMCNFYESNGDEKKFEHYRNLTFEKLKEGL